MKNLKAKVATGATVVLLGGLGGLALSQGNKAPSKPVADKPAVQTKVIRRTIHVTKHAKPKHPPAAAPVEPAAGGSSTGAAYVTTGSSGSGAESAPVTTATSGSESGEAASVTTGSSGSGSESVPVTTATSGGGGGGGEVESDDGGGEVEHEGGGDD